VTTTDSGTALVGEDETVPAKPHLQLDQQLQQWRDAYLQAQAMEKDWAETKERARKHLEQALGDLEEGRVGDQVVVRWSYVKSSRLDQRKLKEQAPDLVAQCTVESLSRRFTVPTGDDQ
jgi:predicted phage-related endonuclease